MRPESISEHLAVAYFCPACKRTLRLNGQGISEHRARCSEQKLWRCEHCDFTLPADCSPMEILQHRRSHGL